MFHVFKKKYTNKRESNPCQPCLCFIRSIRKFQFAAATCTILIHREFHSENGENEEFNQLPVEHIGVLIERFMVAQSYQLIRLLNQKNG